jgi:hypothetical protein
MLNGKLRLWNIEDAEAYTRRTCDRVLTHYGIVYYADWRYEEFVADCIGYLWYMSGLDGQGRPLQEIGGGQFDPAQGNFKGYADRFFFGRCVQQLRNREKRTRWHFSDSVVERPRPQIESIERYDPEGDRLDETLGSSSMDAGELASAKDLRGTIVRGHGPEARLAATGRRTPPGRAQRRAG